jgi:hypothetical protein
MHTLLRLANDKVAESIHGPYYEWSYLKAGKLRHRTLTPEQAELMRAAILNYRALASGWHCAMPVLFGRVLEEIQL